jgi:hypothetical protein
MSRMLSRNQIQRIEAYRIASRLDVVQLKLAMDAPFTWVTLLNALRGRPIQEDTYGFLAQWLERHFPAEVLPDGKTAAAGDGKSPREEDSGEAVGAVRTSE